jgi:predicted transcriptional regulator
MYIALSDLSELGYKWDSSLDPDLTNICLTSSKMVDAHIQRVLPGGYSLELNNIEEVVSVRVNRGLVKAFPKYYHVNSVESIIIVADPITNLTVEADNFRFHSYEQFISARTYLSNGSYYATIKYNSGFSILPEDIVKATILVAQSILSEYFMVKNFNISGLTMFKQGNLQFQRSSKLLNQPLTSQAQLLLAEYRRTR